LGDQVIASPFPGYSPKFNPSIYLKKSSASLDELAPRATSNQIGDEPADGG
jgi:hypothetical protein